MADLVRMRFKTERFPAGSGELVLLDDGRFFVQPDEAMLERIAAREQESVEKSARYSLMIAAGFAALGLASLAAGWASGRIGGRLRERYTLKRPARGVKVSYDPDKGLKLRFPEGALRPAATLEWTPDEYADAGEAERFCAEFQRLKASDMRD